MAKPTIKADPESSTSTNVASRKNQTATPGFVGVIVARNEVDLSFPAEGTLARRLVNIGDHVELGQVVAELDTNALDADIEGMKASIREARATRGGASSSVREARAQVKRTHELARAGVVSARDAEQAVFALAHARSDRERSSALVAQRQASLRKLQATQASAVLKAPIAGQVSVLSFDAGSRVPPGESIVSIMSSARHVRFAVPPRSSDGLGAGTQIRVQFADGDWEATVTSIAPRLDIASQLVFVEASLEAKDSAKLPPVGMRVEVSVRHEESHDAE